MSEHTEQVAFMQWIRIAYPGILAFAIPNGGLRNKVVAAKLKAEGVTSGVPDIFIADGRPGCFIEMKVKPNKATDSQVEIMFKLDEAGYHTAVCYGWDEARKVADYYLKSRHGVDILGTK